MTDLVTTTTRLGALRWVELRCFEIVGGWVADTPADEVEFRVLWNAQSGHHAWRADLLSSRLSIARELPDEVATVGSRGGRTLVDALASTQPGGPRRLEIVAREALPRLIAGYRCLASSTSPASDEPVARIARVALVDVLDDWQRTNDVLDQIRADRILPV